MLKLCAACGCVVGKIRTNNEDNFYFNGTTLKKENAGLGKILTLEKTIRRPIYFGVFDGMGGELFGEEASYLAAETLRCYVKTNRNRSLIDFNTVIQDANTKICSAARARGMGLEGSTAVLLKIDSQQATIANIGDSKAFLYREGYLEQVSVDHTEQALFKEYGIVNRKPRLTQHLGIEPSELVIEPHSVQIDIQPGDQFLLCSDGLTDMVGVEAIKEVLRCNFSPEVTVSELINRAMNGGGKDNTTIVFCKVSNSNPKQRLRKKIKNDS